MAGSLLLPLSGCIGSGEGPLEFFNAITSDPLEGRARPPGLDSEGYPSLATVPPAPARGAASAREELTRALADLRQQSETPVTPGAPVPPLPAGADSSVPANPPPPPRLAAAPRIAPGTELPLPAPGRGTPAAPGEPPAPNAVPADPGQAPAPPPAEMLAPPPPAPSL
jgi:SH3/ankyrin repeat-containing protein